MNKELKELLEMCEDLGYKIEGFRYSNLNEYYMAIVNVIALDEKYVAVFEDENWVLGHRIKF